MKIISVEAELNSDQSYIYYYCFKKFTIKKYKTREYLAKEMSGY